MTRKKVFLLAGVLLAVCVMFTTFAAYAQRKRTSSNNPRPTVLAITSQISVRYSNRWSQTGIKYANAHELVRLAIPKPGAGAEESSASLARLLITTETRTSRADARRRLVAIARTRPVAPKFYSIGGWPAVEIRFQEPLARSEAAADEAHREARPIIQRAMLAIAVDGQVVDFDIWLGQEVPRTVLEEAIAIARSTSIPGKERPTELQRILRGLRQSARGKPRPTPARRIPVAAAVPGNAGPRGFQVVHPDPPTLLPQPGTSGELEIASDDAGQNIVIASNKSGADFPGLSFSVDFGATFNSGTTPFPNNDPTLARGLSNRFYLGGIVKIPSGVTSGCNDWIARSNDNTGASFSQQGFSALCAISGPTLCFPDQPHIAADTFNSSSSGQDQVYAVWRLFRPSFGSPPTCNAPGGFTGSVTPVIACSNDNGVTWTSPVALPLGGDHPRVAVGSDGKVYTVTENGNSVLLTRLSSCSSKPPLAIELGPVVVVDGGSVLHPASGANVECPVPGLDRCDESLSSPTVATDPLDANHLFVTYAQHADAPPDPRGFDFEWIVSRESPDAGNSFNHEFILNKVAARRFMPWSCSAHGTVFAGWYDREAAVDVRPSTDDFTDYLLGSPVFPQTINLTGKSDPQCASGWGFGMSATRSQDDSESCSVQPQQAGQCPSSGSPCDFSDNNCTRPGDSCQPGNGLPKYGDYSGIACAKDRVITAWTSAVAPADLPAGPPITQRSIFSRVVPLFPPNGPPTFDKLQIDITTGHDDARGSSELIAKLASEPSSVICLKPSNSLAPDGICANGDGAADQTGRDTWQVGDVISQSFFVTSPQPFPGEGFGSLTITLNQGPCFDCTSDNWNIQAITVTAIDSTGRLKNQVLLDLFGRSDCIARLRDVPWSQSAQFSLHNPPTSAHLYVGGNADGQITTCSNNGGE